MQIFSSSLAKSLLVCTLLLKTVACANLEAYYCAINTERVKAGVPPLLVDPRIEAAATRHAAYMASKKLPACHVTEDKDNADPGQRLDSAGYNWTTISEFVLNLSPPTNYWLNDPERRATALSKDFKSFGIGFDRDATARPYYVLNLAASDDAAAKGRVPKCAGDASSTTEPFNYINALNKHLSGKKRSQVKDDAALKAAARLRANELISFYATASFLSALGSTETLINMGYAIGTYYATENCYPRADSARFLARLALRVDTIPDTLLCNSGYYTAEGPDDLLCTVVYFAKNVPKNTPAATTTTQGTKPVATSTAAPSATQSVKPTTSAGGPSATQNVKSTATSTDAAAATNAPEGKGKEGGSIKY